MKKNKRNNKNEYVLAIVDGSNCFGPNSCAFVPLKEAQKKGYPYVRGNTTEEIWMNLMVLKGGEELEDE